MTAPTRLYGQPDAEYLWSDPHTVLERAEDDGLDEVWVVEHTVHEPREHLPSVDYVLEMIWERTCEWGEVTEDYPDNLLASLERQEVKDAASALLDLIAAGITYRMADEEVGRVRWTYDEVNEEWTAHDAD